MRVEVSVCDMGCALSVSARPYRVQQGERSVELDLCTDHAQVLEDYLEGTPKITPSVSKRPTTSRKTSRKPAAKKATPRAVTPILTENELAKLEGHN